jgi:hypothetical protein
MSSPPEVELRLSGDLFGGNPRGLLTYLGLNGRDLGDGRWAARTNDDTRFVRYQGLADELEFDNNFDALRDAPDPRVTFDDPDTLARFQELEQQLMLRMGSASDLAAPFHRIQAQLMKSTTADELIAIVKDAYDNIRQVTIESSGELAFPDAGVTLITATDLLIRRARLPAILFRLEQDPDVIKNPPSLDDLEQSVFGSSAHWYREVIGLIHYLGPLLGCLSPRFWCLPAGRPPFAALFSLGMDINGLRNSPMELMQLLPGAGRMEPTPAVEIAPRACRRAVSWWAVRLNQMFQYLCDPTVFANAQGVYEHLEHQHWLLTFGQLFGLTTALQTSGRNYSVQRTLMNTLLDTYADRIRTRRRFDQLCTYDTARAIADRVRARMTEEAAEVLMPVADRAVQSLKLVEVGFFIRKQRADANVLVRIPGEPKPHHRQPQRATALLLKMLRNATHGFGGKSVDPADVNEAVAERVLGHHTGDMPADLVFLPYLYLLDTLSRPNEVRETIRKRASRRGSTQTTISDDYDPPMWSAW